MEKESADLEHLARIEDLQTAGAPAGALLDEVRALLSEAEDWARERPDLPSRTRDALERSQAALAEGEQLARHALATP